LVAPRHQHSRKLGHVLVHYGRSAEHAESLVVGIHAKGGRADAIKADLGTPDGAPLLAREVRSIVRDRLDVLVLNAGISKAATIKNHTIEDFDNLFATNVRSPSFLVQQLLPVLGEGSNIIVISSIGALAIAETTVNFHIKSLVDKLQANDRTHAVTIAVRRGLLQI
jgi:NAD(P)-dependent dehydrogenase (short-subunit alcohol dehydrogenase family)